VLVAWAQLPSGELSYEERYAVLSTRNIFLRERGRPVPSREAANSRSVEEAPPEQSWVLVGLVREDNQQRAYLEDTASSSVRKVSEGETVARGAIRRIRIDGIEYEHENTRVWVKIGQTLTGVQVAGFANRTASPPGAATQPEASKSPAPADNQTLSIEQRMKLRRQQELIRK
jgi:hypothetical protein